MRRSDPSAIPREVLARDSQWVAFLDEGSVQVDRTDVQPRLPGDREAWEQPKLLNIEQALGLVSEPLYEVRGQRACGGWTRAPCKRCSGHLKLI